MARHYRALHGPKNDPLTQKAARYPHESASPADYAKCGEWHEPDYENDTWHWVAILVSVLSVFGVIGILIVEGVTK